MEDVSVSEAKEHLEDLIARAAKGEDVRIVDPKYGSIRLTVAEEARDPGVPRYPKRIPGQLKGLVQISDEALLAPLTEDELAWLSGENSP